MEYFYAFGAGLLSAGGAVLLPGMLNLSVTEVALQAGRRAAMRFAAGIVTVFTAQAAIAVIGANFLRRYPEVIDLLREYAVYLLAALAAYFFYRYYREITAEKSIDQQHDERDVSSPYSSGVSVGLLNFIAIPYYLAISSWLMADDWLSTKFIAKTLFVIGGGLGAFALLLLYVYGARWIDDHVHAITRHIHLVVGSVFVLLAGIQAFRVWGGQ